MTDAIRTHLCAEYPWADRLLYIPVLDSTNNRLRLLGCENAPHGTALFAGFQTGGKGRLGRSFHSPEDMGIYMSLLLRPRCAPHQLMHLTCAVAVAVCDAFEAALGFRPGIKWTNDIVSGSKKLGGILTELRLTKQGELDFVIIGIGINCGQKESDFPEPIRNIAASVDMITGAKTDPVRLAVALLEALARMDSRLLTEKAAILEQYRQACITIGKEISVVRGDEIRHGTARSVNDEGALVVEYPDGTVEQVNAGEVSIRGMYGYV